MVKRTRDPSARENERHNKPPLMIKRVLLRTGEARKFRVH